MLKLVWVCAPATVFSCAGAWTAAPPGAPGPWCVSGAR